jgi:23S rRNA (adenine2503-C2)-methyltransferase
MIEKPFIFDLDLDALNDMLKSWGEPGYRAKQIWHGLYQNLWQSPDEFTVLPLKLRQKLSEQICFSHLESITTLRSTDGETEKILFKLPNGHSIETVRMLYDRRRTLCISTQSGCAMGCTFCATGQMGFQYNLSSGEIVEQVLFYARKLRQIDEKVTNIVIMGMGEPFHNYHATLDAIRRLNHSDGMKLGARRFTISTVGIVPAIKRFTDEELQVNLAISLHAANDELRSSMMPINNKYPIADLMAATRSYAHSTRRRVSFEWALIHNVNDTLEQAILLAELLKGMLAHVNLIPLNPTLGFDGQASTETNARVFQAELKNRGISCTIRTRRGVDIQAGCGQLASQPN